MSVNITTSMLGGPISQFGDALVGDPSSLARIDNYNYVITYSFDLQPTETQFVENSLSAEWGLNVSLSALTLEYHRSIWDLAASSIGGVADLRLERGVDADIRIAAYVAETSNYHGVGNIPDPSVPQVDFLFTGWRVSNFVDAEAFNEGYPKTLAAMPGDGFEGISTAIHELLHNLGLKDISNPSNYGYSFFAGKVFFDERYSIMAYPSQAGGNNGVGTWGNAVTPMAFDVDALQHLYGGPYATNHTKTSYKLTDAGSAPLDIDGSNGSVSIGRAFYCIVDTGDNQSDDYDYLNGDEIRYQGANSVLINLNAATLSDQISLEMAALIAEIASTSRFQELDVAIKEEYTGTDAALYQAGGFISRILLSNASEAGGFTIANGVEIEGAFGSSGNDLLIGNELNNRMAGYSGDDVIHGWLGADVLDGTGGNDTVFGGDGDDDIKGSGNDDLLIGGAGSDLLRGGTENDVIYAGEFLTSGQQYESWDPLEINNTYGDSGNDTVYACMEDSVSGGDGNDVVHGGYHVRGGAGNDQLILGPQPGVTYGYYAYGDAGADVIDLRLATGSMGLVFGGTESDTIIGGAAGFDNIDGGSGNDFIVFDSGSGTVIGGSGTDTISFEFYLAELEIQSAGQTGSNFEFGHGDNEFNTTGVEVFQFSDTTVTAAYLRNLYLDAWG